VSNLDAPDPVFTDPLTGLWNRRYLDAELIRSCSLARRRREPVAIVMLSIDQFEAVNQAHGHQAGDEVLVAVADHLRVYTRLEDLIGRLGGDEFVIILASTDTTGAARVATRLGAAIGRSAIETGVGPVQVTLSAGVGSGDGSDPADIIHRAESSLKAAKAAGGNSVATD
jgi:two-component system cell cycle response regulator